jgi:hypothetical protein
MSTINRVNGVTGTAVTNAVTVTGRFAKITTEALTTAAGATYTLTVTDTAIAATDLTMVSVGQGTSSAGMPTVARVEPAAGSLVIIIQNIHASAALNGTLLINIMSFAK